MRTRITISEGPRSPLGWVALAGAVEDDEPVMPKDLRTIDGYVVSLVLAGEGRYRDEQQQDVPITASTLTIVPPHWPHWYGTAPGHSWTEWFFVVDGPLFALLQDRSVLGSPGPRPLTWPAAGDDLAMIIGAAPRTLVAAERQLLSLAGWLTTARSRERPSDDRWDRAEELLGSDLAGSVDLTEIARSAGVHYDVFRREFRRRFGRAPLAYRTERRLESAAALLRLTDLTLRSIAQRLGFTDEFYLSRQFRRRFGLPPRDYRRRHQGR